jgi:hypothetical protein
MKLALLLTPDLGEIPPTIKTLEDWGDVSIIINNGEGATTGKHVYLEGQKEEFVKWLKPFDGVWFQKGTCPMMQEFEIGHIKEDV